jgi:hypothetical protein
MPFPHSLRWSATLLAVGGALLLPASAQQLTKAQSDYFETKIRPILANSCYECHSQQAGKSKGDLLLDTKQAMLKGGGSGPAVVPGNPDKSLLIKAVSYKSDDLQMPPKGKKLSDQQIADLTQWVKMGAPDPRTGTAVAKGGAAGKGWINPEKAHWAFQPVKKPAVPDAKGNSWVVTPVDAFILAKLDEKGMKPNAAAEKRTLLRRATFDLIGLPPTPKEIEAFLADETPQAFEKVVDRLLASPHYGERWGRYWLDTARYADTKGDVRRRTDDPHYANAWTYRDYVIDAFNKDKPYNRFIVEQIAADKLTTGVDRNALAGLGFLTLGDRFNNNNNEIINDRIDVVSKGFLGLTVACARCHDHKFDPIPTKDYYSLHGIFASSGEPKDQPILAINTRSPAYADFQRQIAALENEMKVTEAAYKAAKGSKDKKATKQIQNREGAIRSKMVELEMNHPGAPARANVMQDKEKPADSPVFIRGEAENKGDIAPRRFLEILSGPTRTPYRFGSGRLELARDISNPANPLTPRVMVNRIWMHHFGEGFVTTPDDFGNQSAPPSHPELLDYLASRFIDDGWSIKKMHKLIMLSNTYQQSSANNPRYAQIDPENRYLWRANLRRLDFEALRDSVLAIGGKLDATMGGKPVNIGTEPYSTRRTVYGYIDRRNLAEVFNQFDFANPDITTGKRYETIVPQQSLFMMNNPLVVEQARNLVHRPDFTKLEDDEEDRITLLYELIFQREPTELEIKLGIAFLSESPLRDAVPLTPVVNVAQNASKKGKGKMDTRAPARTIQRRPLGAWEKYAHALLQTNEATFIN